MNKETLIEYFISYLPTLKVLSVNCKNVHKNKDMAITLENDFSQKKRTSLHLTFTLSLLFAKTLVFSKQKSKKHAVFPHIVSVETILF